MDIKDLQNLVGKVFKSNFGYTPFNERMEDINREYREFDKWTDFKNLKEEAGDLLASLIQLHTENDWDVEENIQSTLNKINSRKLQYKSLGRKTNVAIYGGAFDPITTGHIQVAQFILNTSKVFDEVWILPAYRHMNGKSMATPENRLEMSNLASEVDGRIKIFDYEIKNELAGETYYFVKRLKEEKELTEQYNFSIVIGLDNANTFENWVNYESLERLIRFVVVPRKGYDVTDYNAWYLKEPHIFLNGDNPVMEVSSTEIRKLFVDYYKTTDETVALQIKDKIPKKVFDYIMDNGLYNG